MIPPNADGEFVARMEDLLDLYAEPFSPARPVVCMDEASKQLVGEMRPALPAGRGHAKRVDYEYRRNGTVNLFVCVQPRGGWRMVRVTDHRARTDWALVVRELLDVHFPDAETPVGSTSLRMRSVFSPRSVSTAGSKTLRSSAEKSPHGNVGETRRESR